VACEYAKIKPFAGASPRCDFQFYINRARFVKKIRKISLIIFLILLLLGVALVYVVKSFDANDLKPRMQNFFQQKYQRKLDMPGNLKIVLFPVVQIESGPMRLMEKNGSDVFASIESAELSLQLRPLIDGRLEINSVTLNAPSVHIKRFNDGTTNIDDLLTGGDRATPAFDITGLKINRATWLFDDLQTRWQINNANLAVGRLASGVPTDFSFAGDVRLNQDDYNVHLELKSPLLFDLDKQNFSLQKLVLGIKGQSKAANKPSMNDIELSATGSMAFDAAKKQTHFGQWQIQSQLANGDEKWNASVAFSEAEQEGKTWRAKNISSRAQQQTATYSLDTKLTLPEFSSATDAMRGNNLKLETHWEPKAAPKKIAAQKSATTKLDAIDAVLTIGALDDVNDAGAQAKMVNLHDVKLDAKVILNSVPVTMRAESNLQIIDNNQILTKTPVKLNFSYQPEDFSLNGAIQTGAQIRLDRGHYKFTPMNIDLKITLKDFKQPIKLSGSGTADADVNRKTMNAKLQGKLNEAKLGGTLGVNGFAPPAYSFDIFLNQFNTAWLKSNRVVKSKQTELPDFGWVKKLNANGQIRIGELVSADKRATNVRIDVKSDSVK
jgi:AsmA protein